MLSRTKPAHVATKREREEALRRGAQALRARWPKLQADILVDIGPNPVEAHAAWLFAGVILVTVRWSGDVIAQSLPGRPYVLDELCARGAPVDYCRS